MACGARLGLKLGMGIRGIRLVGGLNGLWSPFGFEIELVREWGEYYLKAKWPVEPVWVPVKIWGGGICLHGEVF